MSDWWVPPKLWPGRTCYILGGGPSLSNVDLDRLRGQRVIVVNRAMASAPWADVLYFMDHSYWLKFKEEIAAFQGLAVTTTGKLVGTPGILVMRRGNRHGLDKEDTFSDGSNSGRAAIALAYRFGCAKAVLFGFDMKLVDGKKNYHDDYAYSKERPKTDAFFQDSMVPSFESLNKHLKEDGQMEVVNATPGSALPCFPIVDPEEVYP